VRSFPAAQCTNTGKSPRAMHEKKPRSRGAIHAGNMTQAAAVTKFMWVLAQVMKQKNWSALSPDNRKALVSRLMVERSVVGEF